MSPMVPLSLNAMLYPLFPRPMLSKISESSRRGSGLRIVCSDAREDLLGLFCRYACGRTCMDPDLSGVHLCEGIRAR